MSQSCRLARSAPHDIADLVDNGVAPLLDDLTVLIRTPFLSGSVTTGLLSTK